MVLPAKEENNKEKHKFSFGVFITPHLANHILTHDDRVPAVVPEIYRDIEKTRIGFSAGFTAGYPIHKKIMLQTGFSFSDYGYRIRRNNLTFDPQFDGSGFNPALPPLPGAPKDVRIIFHYYFIDIPLQCRYVFF